MRILYIDTTTSYLYAGIVEENKLVAEIKENLGKNLSVYALKKISELLENINLKPDDIDKIMIVNGPGSFTGIRVGVTIAKTIAYTLNKEIVTISSIEAMTLSSKKETCFKIPLIDARRGYVYSGIYTDELSSVLKEQYIKLDTIKCAVDNLIDTHVYITNDDIDVDNKEEYNPDIEKIVNAFIDKESINPHAVNPEYLKLTEAEENLNLEII